MKKIINLLCNSAMLMSAIIGAGLLGGKELIYYFQNGTLSVILFVVMFVAVNYYLLSVTNKANSQQLPELTAKTFGKLSPIMYAVFCIAYFIVIAVMLAGAQQCMTELLGIELKFPLFSMLTAFACSIILNGGIEKIQKFNQLATIPTLLFILCAFVLARQNNTLQSPTVTQQTITNSLQYVGYNGALSLGVICTIKQNNKKDNLLIAIISGILLGSIIAMLLCLPIKRYNTFAMPTLQAIKHISWLYGFGTVSVFLAIMTSVLSNSFVLVEDITQCTNDRTFAVSIVMVSATILSVIGIDALIQNCYPFIALLSLITIIFTAIRIRQGVR